MRSARLERATPSVSATAFIANRSPDRSRIPRAGSVFCPGEVESLLQALGFHGLAAEKTLQIANSSFELADAARADDILVGLHRLMAPSSIRRFQAKSWEGAMPARRATNETDMPGCIIFSISRTFSAVDQRRQR